MTFNNVSILVPYTSDNGIREKNWTWLKKRYELLMPDVEICIGESTGFPYSRSEAINNAARKATRDIFLIMDADVLFDIKDIEISINMLSDFKIVFPLSKYVKLDNHITKDIISNSPNIPISEMKISTNNSKVFFNSYPPGKYKYIFVGAICLIHRKQFEECGGFDERFRGWGGEDDAFAHIAKYLYKNFGRPTNTT
ncbi:galactosyltransferase-related protein, partial [Romboutsia sp.]|uniref:galactosyltransferase-related protein n=1 Tax=Romboutsia sp. TaxID=1965302 RepID=UPI002CC004F8